MSANPRPDAGLKPVTVPDFLSARAQGRKLVVVTAYDYALARIVDSAGVDSILVGDSLGMVVQGHHHCLEVTLRDVIYHTRCVQRAVQRSLIVADLPFMTYQVSAQQAVKSAGKLVQKGGAHAVKLEGGERSADAIRAIVDAEIPVMGHVGLTPQSVRRIGGFRVQRDEKQIIADAKAVESAGAFAVVIECVPATVAAKVTAELKIPTIGIGAGSACDGQVLVGYDLLGMFDDVRPKFAKRYAEIGQAVRGAVADFCNEVRGGQFPSSENEFK